MAYAGAGRVFEFDRARGQAQELLDRRNPSQDPASMYYLTPSHLDCQAGYSLIMMGRRQHRAGDARSGNKFIREGQRLLRTGAHDRPLHDPSRRRALYEGSWLALGSVARGQIEEACAFGRTAMARLDEVKSPRSVRLLRQLATDLSRRKRNESAAELLPDLHAALARQPG